MFKPVKIFVSVLSQMDDNYQEAKYKWIEKMLPKMAALPHILYIRIKAESVKG